MIRMPAATSTDAVTLDLSGLTSVLTVLLVLGVIVLLGMLWKSGATPDPGAFGGDDDRRARDRADSTHARSGTGD